MRKFRLHFLCLFGAFLFAVKPSTAETLKIAVVTPEESSISRDIQSGIEAAMSKEGIDKSYTLQVDTYTESCQKAKDDTITEKIILSQPDMVIGYFCTASAIAAQRAFANNGIPFFSLSIVDPRLTKYKNSNTVRLTTRTDRQFKSFAHMLKENYPEKKFLILDDTSKEAKNFIKILSEEIPATHSKIINLPSKEAEVNIKKISDFDEFKPDFVLISSVSPVQAVRMISRLREAGLKTPVIGLDVLGTPEFAQMIGAMKDDVYFYGTEDARHSLDAATLIAELRFYNVDPSFYTVSSYAAVQIWWQANQKAGAEHLKLHNQTFKTVLGDLSINAFGDVEGDIPSVLYRWQENTFFPVY